MGYACRYCRRASKIGDVVQHSRLCDEFPGLVVLPVWAPADEIVALDRLVDQGDATAVEEMSRALGLTPGYNPPEGRWTRWGDDWAIALDTVVDPGTVIGARRNSGEISEQTVARTVCVRDDGSSIVLTERKPFEPSREDKKAARAHRRLRYR
jgi:hypothetical protein